MESISLVAGVLVSLGIIAGALVGVFRVGARVTRIHDVILGADGNPGVAERLKVLELRTEQLIPNGGTTMKDRVTETVRAVKRIDERLEAVRVQHIEERTRYDDALAKLQHDLAGARADWNLMAHLVDRLTPRPPPGAIDVPLRDLPSETLP